MDRTLLVHGEFRLSNGLAEKMQQVAAEVWRGTFLDDLAHRGEGCPLCSASTVPIAPDALGAILR